MTLRSISDHHQLVTTAFIASLNSKDTWDFDIEIRREARIKALTKEMLISRTSSELAISRARVENLMQMILIQILFTSTS